MKKNTLLFLIAFSIGMIQSAFLANAQLCTNPQVLNFGTTISNQQNTGTNRNSTYGTCSQQTFPGNEKVYTFSMVEPGFVSIFISNIVGPNVSFFLLSSCSPVTCIAQGISGINDRFLQSGTYFVVVDGLTANTVSSFSIRLEGKTTSGHCIPDFEITGCGAFIDSIVVSSPGRQPTQNINSGCANNTTNFSVITSPASSIFREGDQISVDYKVKGSGNLGAWMDFNNNGSFDDAGEYLPVTAGKFSFIVPPMSAYGPKRMRLRCAKFGVEGVSNFIFGAGTSCTLVPASTNASLESPKGETEDYILNIEPRCTPSYTNSCTGSAINSFILKGISNQNSGCNNNTFNYINYPESQFTTTLSRGVSYTANVGLANNQSAAIWIDYNNDGDFLDIGELVASNTSLVASWSPTITIPNSAPVGPIKLRVRSLNTTRSWANADACAILSASGETEDYVIKINNQTISLANASISNCRGASVSIAWTTAGDFLPGNRFFAQFSNSAGSFSTPSQNTEIELVGNSPLSIPIPANLTPGGAYKFKLISTNPVRSSSIINVTILSANCATQGLSTGKIGQNFEFSVCKGIPVLIGYSNVNFAAGTIFKVQISGKNGALPFVDIPGATGTTTPISAVIPFSTPQGSGYKIRVVSTGGFIGSNSPTTLNLTTCLTVSSPPATLCRGISSNLAISATGVPAGTRISAELSSASGVFSSSSPVIIGTTSSSLTSVSVTVPCSIANGTGYRIRLIPNSPATPAEAGTATSKITINTDCPQVLASPSVSFGSNSGFCLNKTYSLPEIFAQGCFKTGNAFFIDFLSGSATGPVVASVAITASGQFTIPANFPVASNLFYRIRSTNPVVNGPALGPVRVLDCPSITINSICRTTCNTYVVDFTAKGTFEPGNQFKVQMNSQFGNPGPTIDLGNPGTGSPLIVPIAPDNFPAERRIQVVSTIGAVQSNFVSADFVPACAAPTVTVTGLSTVLTEPGPAGSPPSATVCIGQKLRIDFTTTGVFCPGNQFFAQLGFAIQDFDFSYTLDGTSPTSPIIVTVGPFEGNINPVPASTTIRVGATNPSTLTFIPTGFGNVTFASNCPSIATGAIANTNLCAAATISVPFTTTGTFNAGNTFSAELSDANGNFGNPIALVGSRASSPLTVTLPNFPIDAGTGYRIRVKSSSPETAGLKNTSNLTLNPPVLTNASVPKDPFIGDPVFLTGSNLTGVNRAFFGNVQTTFSGLTNSAVQIIIPNGFQNNDCQVRRNGCVSNNVILQDQIQAATNFNLFNATTDANLGVLKGGSTIDLTDLTSFNIRGNLNSAGFDLPGATTPGSVKMELNGPVSQTVIDNNSPFTFFGETVRPDGTVDFLGSTLPPGNYTIKATPYVSDNAVGNAGVIWTTAFSVAPARVISTGALPSSVCQGQNLAVSFSTTGLFKAETQFTVELSDAVGSFANSIIIGTGSASPISALIPVGQPVGSAYRIRVSSSNPSTPTLFANSSGAITVKAAPVLSSISESVVWSGDQVTLQGTGFGGVSQVLFNGLASGNFNLLGNGNNKLKARVPTGATSGNVTIVANGGCASLNGIAFTVPKIVGFSIVNTSNQQVSNLSEGSAIALNENTNPSFSVQVEPAVAGSVRFELVGPTSRNVKDNNSPFSFCGDVWDGTQSQYQTCNQAFTPGIYSLKATPFQNSGNSKAGESKTINFSLVNAIGRMAATSGSSASTDSEFNFQVFPNPTSGKIILKQSSSFEAKVRVLNVLGQEVLNIRLDGNSLETMLDLSSVPSGVYQVLVESAPGNKEIRIIKQ